MTRAVTVAAPEGELAEAVTALVAGSDAVGLARLELALRALAGQLGRSGSEARVLAVRRGTGEIEVALDRRPRWKARGEQQMTPGGPGCSRRP